MKNEYRGQWTEQERRVVDRHFKGWILHKVNRYGKKLYRAQFRRYEYGAFSIAALIELASNDGAIASQTDTIVPVRTIADVAEHHRYPDRVKPAGWETSRENESDRNRVALLKRLGR